MSRTKNIIEVSSLPMTRKRSELDEYILFICHGSHETLSVFYGLQSSTADIL